MSNALPQLSLSELANVVGGTDATTPKQAVKNYLSDNGNGNWFQQAGALGSKAVHRAQYSLGFINYQTYADMTAAAPGGANYIEDMKRIRPAR